MRPSKVYYFDNNATTRVAPEVVAAMVPYLNDYWGNPSSAYSFGNRVMKDIEGARARVAAMLGAEPREVIFTSCGTESNNTAIHSALLTQPNRRHVLMTAVEHSANIKYGNFLLKQGYDVTFLPVESDGLIDVHLLETSIRPDTAIVSVMWANNETGVILPIEEIAAICRSKGVMFHTDAVQVPGKAAIDVHATGVDFLSISAHKLHAPKGIGALFIRRRTPFQSFVIGGQQERGCRGGTENVPYIIGFGRAAELAVERLDDENQRVRKMRDRLEEEILRRIPGAARNGAREPRLPNTTNLSFAGVEAEAVLLLLDQECICASSGSACTTGSLEPSHVLTSMGLARDRARGSLRFSLGFFNSDDEVDYVLEKLPPIIERLRASSPRTEAMEETLKG
jgi:cysteine desulfurase